MGSTTEKGIKRLINATSYSMKGFKAAWQNEEAFRQESILMLIMCPAAFWLGENLTQIALLLMTCFIVVITELLNSAIEAIVDRVGTEKHELSGRAKDMGSAAVLVSLAITVIVWSLIAYGRFFST